MFRPALVFECRKLHNIPVMRVFLGLVVAICGLWTSAQQGKMASKAISAGGNLST